MTIDERLDRIEHWTAGIAEERRKDREEYNALWRDTQRHLNELGTRLIQFAEESRDADKRLEARIEQIAEESRKAAEESREADKRLGARIDSLVSGFGKFIAENKK